MIDPKYRVQIELLLQTIPYVAAIHVVSMAELYDGKIYVALDRQQLSRERRNS